MHAQREIINRALWNLVCGMKESVASTMPALRKTFEKLSDEEFATLTKTLVSVIDDGYNHGCSVFMRSVDAALERVR